MFRHVRSLRAVLAAAALGAAVNGVQAEQVWPGATDPFNVLNVQPNIDPGSMGIPGIPGFFMDDPVLAALLEELGLTVQQFTGLPSLENNDWMNMDEPVYFGWELIGGLDWLQTIEQQLAGLHGGGDVSLDPWMGVPGEENYDHWADGPAAMVGVSSIQIPEPMTLTCLILGAGALGAMGRPRRSGSTDLRPGV